MKRRIFALIVALGMLITSASALTVEQAKDLLNEFYIDEISEDVLAHDTVDEMLSALGDPYTGYYTAEELAGFYATMEDVQLVGIGVRSFYRAQGVEVTQVAPGGPAAEGGLRTGDWIIAVDGHDARGAAEEDLDTWLRGETGTQVTLTVLRGEETFDVVLTRRPVVFPTVMLEKIQNGIGWISCSSFGSKTFAQFCEILTAYDSQVTDWVVDLRGNSGGNAFTAVLSAGCFGGWNSGIYMRDGSNRYYAYLSSAELVAVVEPEMSMTAFDKDGYLTRKTVCVLTDEDAASASELFCAVIRDSGVGVVIGARTFGKGVAQTLLTRDTVGMEALFADGDGIKITSERCFSMAGSTYDQVGILPHVLVDGDLADEVTALLMAPYVNGDDALILRDVCRTSTSVQHFVMPLELLCAPEQAAAVEQLLLSLTPDVTCQLYQNGETRNVSVEEAAQACGLTWSDRQFSDLEGSAFADEIEVMRLYGLLKGYEDGTFCPERELTRAETCALIAQAFRYPLLEEEVSFFADVEMDSWYTPYINAMFRLGFIQGDGDGNFRPTDTITHEEFLVLLGRVAQWLDMDYYEFMRRDGIYGEGLPTKEELEQQYGAFHKWAREEIWLCEGEYAWAEVSDIVPDTATTREEAATAMYRLFCRSGLLAD